MSRRSLRFRKTYVFQIFIQGLQRYGQKTGFLNFFQNVSSPWVFNLEKRYGYHLKALFALFKTWETDFWNFVSFARYSRFSVFDEKVFLKKILTTDFFQNGLIRKIILSSTKNASNFFLLSQREKSYEPKTDGDFAIFSTFLAKLTLKKFLTYFWSNLDIKILFKFFLNILMKFFFSISLFKI